MSDVKSGRRARYAELTRRAVLDAAKTLFVTAGFEATSVDEIARVSESSKGAVYHHFSDKREIFTEVFRISQLEIMRTATESMGDSAQPWDRVEAATHGILRSYAADESARALLRQAIGVLGWDRVRALDEETALPLIRATVNDLIETGAARPLPIEATSEILFSLYCNAILFIADHDTDAAKASRDAETVLSALLQGLQHHPNSTG